MDKYFDECLRSGSFLRFIVKQRYIVTCFLLATVFIVTLVLFSLRTNRLSSLGIPTFLTFLLLYISLISASHYYRIFSVVRKLRKGGIDYWIESLEAEVTQDPLRVTAPRSFGGNVSLPINQQKVSVTVLVSHTFALLIIWYNEVGFYKKLSTPLWLDLKNASDVWERVKPEGIRKIAAEEIQIVGNDVSITITSCKNDFRQVKLLGFSKWLAVS